MSDRISRGVPTSDAGSPTYPQRGYPNGSAQCLVVEQQEPAVSAAISVGPVLVDSSSGSDKQKCVVGNNFVAFGNTIVSPTSLAPSSVSADGVSACGDLRSIIQ